VRTRKNTVAAGRAGTEKAKGATEGECSSGRVITERGRHAWVAPEKGGSGRLFPEARIAVQKVKGHSPEKKKIRRKDLKFTGAPGQSLGNLRSKKREGGRWHTDVE